VDYFGILKKAWNITWRYKALWVLGLFAGAGSGGSSGGSSNYSTGSDELSSGGTDAFTQWMGDNWLAFAIVMGVLVMIGLVFWVLSVAAQGGLVHGSNEAAEGRTPSLRDAWGVGFSKWGRTFMISFVLGLPVIVVAILMGVLIAVSVGGGALLGSGGGSDAVGTGAAVGAFGGLCCILPIFVVLIIAASIILGIVYPLALRYGILEDTTFGQAIMRGWNDLRAKRGAFMMWLVMLLPQFALGFVMLALMVPFMVPAFAFFIAEKYVMGTAFFALMALVMLVPTAIYGTFVSTAWTVFFRQMTGVEASGAAPAPAFAQGVTPPTYAPPAPPAYEPPAPPADAPIVDVDVPSPTEEPPLADV
jgi:hypothetical protein